MSLRTPCLGLVLAAVHAAGQGLPAPPPEGGQSRPWRESIDQGRDRLADQLLGIKLSAFGDGLFGPDDQGRKKLDWGAFELDLAGEFHENLEAAFAVVSTQEATQLAVGTELAVVGWGQQVASDSPWDAPEPGTYAYNCLMARRLAERNVRCIQVYERGWDAHNDLPNRMRAL